MEPSSTGLDVNLITQILTTICCYITLFLQLNANNRRGVPDNDGTHDVLQWREAAPQAAAGDPVPLCGGFPKLGYRILCTLAFVEFIKTYHVLSQTDHNR